MITPIISETNQFAGFTHECPENLEFDVIKATQDPFGDFDWFRVPKCGNLEVIESCPFCSVNLKASLSQFDAKKWIEEAEYPLGMTKVERRDFRRSLRKAFGVAL